MKYSSLLKFLVLFFLLANTATTAGAQQCEEVEPSATQIRLQKIIDNISDPVELSSRLEAEGEIGSIIAKYGDFVRAGVFGKTDDIYVLYEYKNTHNFALEHIMLDLLNNETVEEYYLRFRPLYWVIIVLDEKYCIFDETNFLFNMFKMTYYSMGSDNFWLKMNLIPVYRNVLTQVKFPNITEHYVKFVETMGQEIFYDELKFWNTNQFKPDTGRLCMNFTTKIACLEEIETHINNINHRDFDRVIEEYICFASIVNNGKFFRFNICDY